VILFDNGYVKGEGTCRLFMPSKTKGQAPTITTVPLHRVPRGKIGAFADDYAKFVVLGRPPGASDPLKQRKPDGTFNNAIRELKRNYLDVYNELVKDVGLWETWVYLKGVKKGGHLASNLTVLRATQQIQKQYFTGKDGALFKLEFESFYNVATNEAIGDRIKELLPTQPLTLVAFKTLVTDIGKDILVSTLLAGNFDQALKAKFVEKELKRTIDTKLPILSGESDRIQNLGLLATTEPALAHYLYTIKNLTDFRDLPDDEKIFSETVFQELDKWVSTAYVSTIPNKTTMRLGGENGARRPFIAKMNQLIGENVATIQELRQVTADLIYQNASSGGIFENWFRKYQLLNNLGKKTFDFDDATPPNVVDAPTATQKINKHIIDCHYIEKATDMENNKMVGIECKHIQKELRPDDLDQLQKNVILVKPFVLAGTAINLTVTPNKRLKRIEYVFSNKAAAELNKAAFTAINNFKPSDQGDLFRVFYFDDDGIKQEINFK
jgi:hypothetical protein